MTLVTKDDAMSSYGLRIGGARQRTTNADVLPSNQHAAVKEEVSERRVESVDEIHLAAVEIDVGYLAQCQPGIRRQLSADVQVERIRRTLCRCHKTNETGCPIPVLRQNTNA